MTRPTRPLRADAERNRLRVHRAAEDAFRTQGLQLTMDDIAARAGVGKATVYRTFPDRRTLVTSMARAYLERFADAARTALSAPDLDAALTSLLSPADAPDSAATMAVLVGGAGADLDEVATAQRRAMAALDELLDAAKAVGAVRPEVTSRHLTALFSGFASSGHPLDGGDRDTVVREAVEIILRGIRTRP